MIQVTLAWSGLLLAVIGGWSGYRNAREALLGFLREGDPTRSAIEAARPAVERVRVRRFARQVAFAIGWIVLAIYGIYLASLGLGVSL